MKILTEKETLLCHRSRCWHNVRYVESHYASDVGASNRHLKVIFLSSVYHLFLACITFVVRLVSFRIIFFFCSDKHMPAVCQQCASSWRGKRKADINRSMELPEDKAPSLELP